MNAKTHAMTSAQILGALRKKYPNAAFIPELTIFAHGVPARRIDALMFDGDQRTAIEIKISKADAARETYEKTQQWRELTHRFVYVVPAGLLELPPMYGAGLWEVHPDGEITVKRKATINKYPELLPQQIVTRIAYKFARTTRQKYGDAK